MVTLEVVSQLLVVDDQVADQVEALGVVLE